MDQLLNDFSPGLFFMQAIILLILILLMGKFAWKPIMNSLNEREDGIKSALEEAENARKEMQNLTADNEKMMKQARVERDAILKESREIGEKLIEESREEAKEQATLLINAAIKSIEQEKEAALAHIKKEIAEISIGIAEAVVKRELTAPGEQEKLVEGMLQDITLN